MIARIEGLVVEKQENSLVVLTASGVGYSVFVTTHHAMSASLHKPITLITYFKVSDSAQDLFGFESIHERTIFLSLISVSGVGPKTALHILSGGSLDQLVNAISSKDIAYLMSVPGVGKRTAERLVVELRDKIGAAGIAETPEQVNCIDALLQLGYTRVQAVAALKQVDYFGKTEEQILKEALKYIGKM